MENVHCGTLYDAFELRKFVVPEFVFGLNARSLVGQYARNLGAVKAMVVTDDGLMDAGWPQEVLDDLDSLQIKTVLFHEVHPNPRDYEVMEGADLFDEESCNMIIAVGGGSPMDCAKGIGIVSANRLDIKVYAGMDNIMLPGPPLICIPSTSGSSADVSQFAVIMDASRKVKLAIGSKKLVPDISLIDPVLLTTVDSYLLSCTGLDALTHAIEAYVSNAQSAVTDVHALESIHLICDSLVNAVKNQDDLSLLNKIMLGSLHAGMAFSNASLGAVHAMAHSLGGLLDLPHGECNAVLLGPVIEYNFACASKRYRRVCEVMGMDTYRQSDQFVKMQLIAAIDEMKQALQVRHNYKEFAISQKEIQAFIDNALNDICMVTNPRIPTPEEIEGIYAEIL